MTSVGLLLQRTERQLTRAGIGDARLEAELIWMTALGLDRPQLYGALRDTPVPEQEQAGEDLVARRLRREPAAYLMGKREFFGLELHMAPGILIPRQDTETLVEEALCLPATCKDQAVAIADVGCGTGAIGIALAVHLPGATVYAMDISERALEITAMNAGRHGVKDRVVPLQGDLLAPVPRPVDLIVANLPYVMSKEIPTLDPEVRLYESREALDGGEDGLELIRRLLAEAPAHLAPHGVVLLEMDPRQVAAASLFAEHMVPGASLRTVRDLAGRERVLVVET